MMTRKLHHLIPAALIAVCLISLKPAARADSGYWAVNGGGNWSATTSWLNGIVADGATNTAYFTNTLSQARYLTLDTSRTLGCLTFGRPSGYIGFNWAFNNSSTLLTLDNGANSPVITCWPLLAAGNSAMGFSQRLSGTNGFTKMGTGTLWLQANNLGISGNLIIAQGRVFTYSTPLALGYMSVIVSNGCYLDLYVGGTYSYNNITLNGLAQVQDGQSRAALYADVTTSVILDSSDTITLNATSDIGVYTTGTLTIGGTITGPGGLVKNGAGTNPQGLLVLGAGAVANYAGPTLVTNGQFAVDTTLVNSVVTNYSGSFLEGIGFIAQSATLLTNATLKPNRTNQIGTLSVSNLTCNTGSKLSFLLNPSDLTEGSYVNDELLVTNLVLNGPTTNLVAFQNTSSPAVGRHVIVEYITASGLTNLTLTPAFATQAYHPGLDISVPGQVALVISNSAIIDVTWVGGNANNLWDLVTTTNWTDGVNPAVFNNGQTVHFTDSGNNATPVLLKSTLQPTLISVESTIDYTFASNGILSGAASLQKIAGSSGVLTLASGTNNYTGGTTISAGTLRLGTNNPIPSGSNYGDFTLSGSTLDMNGFSAAVNDLTTSGTVDNTSTQACTLTIKDVGPDSTGGFIFTGAVGNSGGGPLTLIKSGPSMRQWPTSASASAFTGGFVANDGRCLVQKLGVFGTGPVTVSNGATIMLYGSSIAAAGPVTNDFYLYSAAVIHYAQYNDTVCSSGGATNRLSGTIHLMSTATLGAPGNTAGPIIGELDVFGQITGPGALQKGWPAMANDLGVLALTNAANDFAGGVSLYCGTLRLGASEVIPDGAGKGDVSIINPTNDVSTPQTTLDLSGHIETVNGLLGNGAVTNSAATASSLIVGNNNANGAFLGSIGGAVALQKVGTGTLLLDGTNTYTGGTTVSAGTLGGSGVLASAVSILSAATLAPGDATVGSFNVLSAPTASNPTNLMFSVSGGALQLSWPADHLGWYAQSNAVGVVHSSSWFDIPGSQQETSLSIPINSALPQVYYRLRHP